MCSAALGIFSLIHEMSRNTPLCGLPRPSFISRTMEPAATWSLVKSSGGRCCLSVALCIAPAPLSLAVWLRYKSGMSSNMKRRLSLFKQYVPFAPYGFRDQDALDAGRPNHAGGMELQKLHVYEVCPGVISQRMAISRVFPTVAADFVGPADTAGGQNGKFIGPENLEPPPFPVISQSAHHPCAVFEQGRQW